MMQDVFIVALANLKKILLTYFLKNPLDFTDMLKKNREPQRLHCSECLCSYGVRIGGHSMSLLTFKFHVFMQKIFVMGQTFYYTSSEHFEEVHGIN